MGNKVEREEQKVDSRGAVAVLGCLQAMLEIADTGRSTMELELEAWVEYDDGCA